MMNLKKVIIAALAMLFIVKAKGQIAPPAAIFFHNQYLNNSSFAGLNKGLNIDLGYRQQWSNIPGSPKTQFLTLDYALKGNAGIGLSLYNEKSGLFKQTKLMGTFAYHVPLDGMSQKLSFGAALGFQDEMVDYNQLDGDPTDMTVNNFNQRDQYIDGNFGVLYSTNKLQLQASIPNLGHLWRKGAQTSQEVDQSRFYVAASYKIVLPKLWEASFEPKIAFREIKGYKNIMDIGARLNFVEDKVGVTAIYHTTESASFGLNASLNQNFSLLCVYTSNTAALSGQTNGSFEVNLKMNLFK